MDVGVVGLGNMGSAIAIRLVEKGFNVHVWNRTKRKAEQLARSYSVRVEDTVKRLVENTDTAIVMISDDKAFREIFYASEGVLEGIRKNYVLINSSTTTPMLNVELDIELRKHGAYLLEAPVLGGPSAARKGELIVIAGGPYEQFKKVKEVLEALGEPVHVSERIGDAMVLKLAFNALLISNLQLLSEILGMVEAWGIDTSKVKEILDKTIFKPIVDKYYTRLLAEEYPVSFKLTLAAKDLEYARRTAEERYQPVPVISAAATTYRLASLYGYGGEDYSRISLFLRRHGRWPVPEESTR